MWKAYQSSKSVELNCFYSVFEVIRDSNYFFPGESHDFWEIVYVIQGNICVSADESIYHLSKGDMIFHKPMELHKFHVENGVPATLFIMSFSAVGPLMKSLEDCVLRLSSVQEQYLSQILTFLHGEYETFREIPQECLLHLEQNPLKFQFLVALTELLLLSCSQDIRSIHATANTPETKVYRSAVRIMEKRITEWISVPEIASECNVSVSYLKKIFAKYAGLGIHQYFLKTKIIYASRLLQEGKSVSETAATLSFSSPNYFSTVYKRETGVSPITYKFRIN